MTIIICSVVCSADLSVPASDHKDKKFNLFSIPFWSTKNFQELVVYSLGTNI